MGLNIPPPPGGNRSAAHGISQQQVSKRLRGHEGTVKGDGMRDSVTCRSCGAVFSAGRASALYCGSACRVRAFRAKKGS